MAFAPENPVVGDHPTKQAVPLSRYVVFILLAVGLCAVDLATKRWMFDWLGMPMERPGPWWVWKDIAGFQTSLNPGALFGMGQGFWPLFAAMSVVAALGIVAWLFIGGAASDWLLTIAMGIMTGGFSAISMIGWGCPAWFGPRGIQATKAGCRSTPSAISSW